MTADNLLNRVRCQCLNDGVYHMKLYHTHRNVGVILFFTLFMVANLKGGFFVSKIRDLLSTNKGRIYVYLATATLGNQFLQDAENEGFIFCDGRKPTDRPPANIMAINRDSTINYVGTVGRIAFQAANKIGNEPLIQIDYRDVV